MAPGKEQLRSEMEHYSQLSDETKRESEVLYKELLDDLGMESIFGGKHRLEMTSQAYRELSQRRFEQLKNYDYEQATAFIQKSAELMDSVFALRVIQDAEIQNSPAGKARLESRIRSQATEQARLAAELSDDTIIAIADIYASMPEETKSLTEIINALKQKRERGKRVLEEIAKLQNNQS